MQQFLFASTKFLQSYHCFTSGNDYLFQNLALGTVHKPTHPVMKNVKKVLCHVTVPCKMEQGADLIASYANGHPLVAERQIEHGGIIQLNFSIPSKRSFSNYFDPDTTDMAILIGNCVKYFAQKRRRLNDIHQRLWKNRNVYADIIIM